MASNYVPCDTVGMLRHLLEHIPDEASIRVNGKKAMFCDDANTWTVCLDSTDDDKTLDFYGF